MLFAQKLLAPGPQLKHPGNVNPELDTGAPAEPGFYHKEVRHPPQSGWLDEWGRLKGGRPFYPTPGLSKILSLSDKETECIAYLRIVPHPQLD